MNYWDLVQNQREWSWSIAAMGFLLAALALRHIVLHNVFRKLKQMPRDLRQNIQINYTKRSIPGWILFVLAIAFATALWARHKTFSTYGPRIIWYVMITALLGSAILCHTQAYLSALLQLIEDKMSSAEKEV